MLVFLTRRLAQAVVVLFAIFTIGFALLHLAPADPALLMLGDAASPEAVDAMRKRLGIDRPLPEQYLRYLSRAVRGDFGESLRFKESTVVLIIERMPATAELALSGLALAILVGVPLGGLAAVRHKSGIAHFSNLLAFFTQSLPNFWLGLMLILLFAVQLQLLPATGRGGIRNLILPATTIGLQLFGTILRLTYSSMLQVLGEDYVWTARAKGVRETVVIIKHALRNALIPVVTVIGLQLGSLLAGAIITETIFAWPGAGRLMLDSVVYRDYPLVLAGMVLFSGVVLLSNLLVDILYLVIDPRIRGAG